MDLIAEAEKVEALARAMFNRLVAPAVDSAQRSAMQMIDLRETVARALDAVKPLYEQAACLRAMAPPRPIVVEVSPSPV